MQLAGSGEQTEAKKWDSEGATDTDGGGGAAGKANGQAENEHNYKIKGHGNWIQKKKK